MEIVVIVEEVVVVGVVVIVVGVMVVGSWDKKKMEGSRGGGWRALAAASLIKPSIMPSPWCISVVSDGPSPFPLSSPR